MKLFSFNKQDIKKYEICEKNFKLSNEEKRRVTKALNVLYNLAPSNSYIKLELIKRRDKVYAELLVNSLKCKFIAKTRNTFADMAAQKAVNKVLSQVSNWKSRRFFDDNVFNPISPNYLKGEAV